MAIGQGYKSYIQIGTEAVWGTGVAATKRYEIISMDVNPEQGTILDPSLNNSVGRRGVFQGGIVYRGNIVMRMNYRGMPFIFKHILGVAGTSTLVAGSTYDHVLHDAQTQLSPNRSMTIEMIEGDIMTGKCQRLLGAVVEAATIRGTAGQGSDAMLQVELELVAKDKVVNFTPTGALVAPAVDPVMTKQGFTVDDGVTVSGNLMRSFEINYRCPNDAERFFVGSLNPAEFVRDDFVGATWRFTQDLQTDDVLEALQQFTPTTPDLLFRGGASGANFFEFEVKSDASQLSRASHIVGGYGVVRLESAIESYHHATNGTMYIRFRNEETTIG